MPRKSTVETGLSKEDKEALGKLIASGKWTLTATFPELTARDTSKYAAALQQVVTSAAVAIDRGLMSEETAVALIALIAGRLGLEVDSLEELEKARADQGRREEEDGFPGFPETDEDAEP